MKKIKKMQDGGTPCGPNEVRTPGGRCIKKRFITSPEGVGTVLGAATAGVAAIKKKIAKKKEAKAEVAKTIKDIKGANSKKKMQNGGYYTNTTAGEISKPNPSNSAQMDRGVSKPNTPTTPSDTTKSQSTPPPISRKIDRVAKRLAKGKVGRSYKTGGMVNSNSKVSALKSAGSKGVKSGTNPKATASKVARGRVGGTSTAPKTAVPKAKYGMSMRKK